jgi:PAS domain S-box-containing protein
MIHPKRRKAEAPPPDLGVFQDFINAVGAAVVVLNADREIIYMNDPAARAWGADCVGSSCFKSIRNTREICTDCPFDEILTSHRWIRQNMRMRTRAGWRTHENLYLYVQGQDPGTQVIAMVSMDVHDAHSLKQEVLKERELSRALLESVNSIVIGFDSDGAVEFINHACEVLTGYSQLEIQTSGGVELIVPPDSIENAREYFSSPPDVPRPEKPALIPVVSKAGARKMVSWTYSPLTMGGGDTAGAIALGQDVTERFATRKEAEKKASELEIVNSILARVGSAGDFEEMLSIALERLLSIPAYSNGAAFILEIGATEARRVAIRGFKGDGPGEHIGGTERLFPATAIYNKRIEVARSGSRMHPEVELVNKVEQNSGMVAIPLFPGGHPLGLVMLGYSGDPTDEEMGMEVLRGTAEALELGAENAYLRVKAEQRAREATVQLKVNQALARSLDAEGALEEVAKQIAELLDVDICGVFLFDEGSEYIRLAAGWPSGAVGSKVIPDANLRVHKAAAEVARTLKPLAIDDVASDDRVPEYVSRDYGITSSMHVPLIAEDKFVGAIYLATRSRRAFTAAEVGLVESFARQSSVAMRNISLLNDLRESEERYRTIMENSGVGFILHDGDDLIYANERAGQIVGRDKDSFTKISQVLDLAHPEDRRLMYDNVARRMAGDESVPRDYDVRMERADGSYAVIQLVHTFMNMGGKQVSLVAANDVTDRVEAERAVKASEERYRTLIESSRDAIMIASPKGTILFANTASTRLSGKSADDMIGDSVYDFVQPEEKDTTRRKFVREWEAGRNVARFPVRSLVMGEERFFEATTAILGDPGPSANVMLIASDVTERELARRRLAESEDKYRTIVETTHDAIVSVNRAGEIVYANQAVAPLIGLPADEVVGRNVFSFVHPGDREEATRELARDFKTGKATPNYGLRCVTSDGRTIHVEVNSGLVGWPTEDTLEILVIRDVTDRRLHEEEREERLRAEETLSAVTSLFVDPADMDHAIQGALAELSAFLGGSRAFYVEFGAHGTTIAKALEWSASEDTAFSERTLNVDGKRFEKMFEVLNARGVVVQEDSSVLDSDLETEFREAFDVESIAAVPVFTGDLFRGVLGYTSTGERHSWSEQDMGLLNEACNMISRALERREFLEELARSEKFRSRITESIGEGLVVLANGLVTWGNEQFSELCGYRLDDLLGKTLRSLMPEPGKFDQMARELFESLMEEGAVSIEDSLRRADGSTIDVQFSITSLGMTEQGTGELLVAIKDITEPKRMREEVEAAAEAYSTLFSSAGDALIVHSLDGRIISANERATTYTGFSADELVGMNMRDLAPEKLRGGYSELQSQVSAKGTSMFESRLMQRTGEVLPVEATSRMTRIWGESVVLSAMRDISERKKAEEETAHRAALLSSLNEIVKASTSSLELDTVLEAILAVTVAVSEADAGMIILSGVPGRRIVSITTNKAGDKFHGHLGADSMQTLLTWLEARWQGTLYMDTAADEVPRGSLPFARAFRESGISQALFIPLYSGEKSIGVISLGARKAGTFDERDSGFFDAAGAEIGVSIENALIYRELTAEHERLSLLYRSAQSISGELELQSLLDTTAAEAARVVGAPSALIGLIEPGGETFVFSASYNLDLDLLADLELPVDEGIGGAVVSGKKTMLIKKGGPEDPEERRLFEADPVLTRTSIDFAAAMPLIAGDRVLGVFALERPAGGREFSPEDILLLEAIGRQAGVAIQNARLYEETREHLEALEKAHQDLMVLDRMKSDFVSTVSHELRSPLAVIEGFAKTLTEHYDRLDQETKKESIEIILKKSVALEGLIENILDMSRIEEGRLEIYREAFDAVEMALVVSDEEGVEGLHELIVDYDIQPVTVVADREKTEVVLGNLIRNAVKFSPDGGRVLVSVKAGDDMAAISVRDEGIGIAGEQYERVFDRFYQVDSSETRSFPGSGLGLYIAKELAESMGGTIWLESEQGRGSTFTFTLPLA